jgi:uncharacterized protein (DUF2235 family)
MFGVKLPFFDDDRSNPSGEGSQRKRRTDKTIKRLVVCSDGTWQTLETKVPTNVRYMTMAIDHEDDEGMQQVLMYDAGIGTANAIDRQLGGALGEGIDINILELYTFLALNYQTGDEVYMFGFSRGAYTVRSLAGLIHEAGLVRRDKLDRVKEAYDLYRSDEDPESEVSASFRAENGERIPIKLLACWDTYVSRYISAVIGHDGTAQTHLTDDMLPPVLASSYSVAFRVVSGALACPNYRLRTQLNG